MKYLNTEIAINGMMLKNRLVMPPMATSSANDGAVSQKLLDYYAEKSSGGYIGLIITEHCYVNVRGMADPSQISVSRDSDIEGLSKLAEVIHNNGSKAIVQISHAGSAAVGDFTGLEPISASAVVCARSKGKAPVIPMEMTHEMIAGSVCDFANAARRVKEAGFDGVEIHSAHGYLLNQFYSPLTNKRSDEYTGHTLEGRLRFHKEVIAAVRKEVGSSFPVALRLGGCDYMEGGSTIEDAVNAAKLLQSCGIDLIDVTGGMNGYTIPGVRDQGYFAPMSRAIKDAADIPVMLTGGVTDATVADALISDGAADLIGVGRAILKDSLWAKKAMEQA